MKSKNGERERRENLTTKERVNERKKRKKPIKEKKEKAKEGITKKRHEFKT